MKRTIAYQTVDGKTFHDRRQAAAHEVAVVRVKRITDFLTAKFEVKAGDKVSLEQIAEKISEHANDFAELVSARATKRYIKKTGNVAAATGLVGRRPRGAVVLQKALAS
jgi:hypothetical protein